MYRIKRPSTRWIKNHKKKGYLLPKKCVWAEQHSPARQSKKSRREKRK